MTHETVEAVFLEMAERNGCHDPHDPCVNYQPVAWCDRCLMRVAAEAWAERERCVMKTVTLATRKEQP
jgi:hypothetical protein